MNSVVICPWCGTNYLSFQSNCSNCGGTIPAPARSAAEQPQARASAQRQLTWPPSPPRSIAPNYVWKILGQDGWVISMAVFVLLGFIFTVVGGGLTLGIITAFVGLPFVGIGLLFLGGGGAVIYWRYQQAVQTVEVLKSGRAKEGEIIGLEPNHSVRINGRMPWNIRYQFTLDGKLYEGVTSTLNNPQLTHAPGPAVVLYLPEHPEKNQLYPHP
ncbi:MAG: hypothetical protein KJZ53_04930 [Anaerolineales bacterium]|nr:hypothetical protein [Anaerolineales bacterium]